MKNTKSLGDLGEKIAEKYLKDGNYKILDRNFRYSRLGELDLVAQKDERVIFFEVKTRQKIGPSDFLPEDNITFAKQKKLIKLAQIYLSKNPPAGRFDNSWQIDILAVEIYRNGSFDIRHTENAIADRW